MLPGVTCHDVDVVDSERIGIVQVEIEQGVAFQLCIMAVFAKTAFEVTRTVSQR